MAAELWRGGWSRVQSAALLRSISSQATPISVQAYKTGAYLFLVGMLATHAYFFWSVRGRIARGDPDFTVFYTAGKVVREGLGSELYEPGTQKQVQREFATDTDIRQGALPYIHPPFELLVFLPLTFLPYRAAFVTWNLVNLGLLAGVMWLLKGSVAWMKGIPVWLLVLASLAFFPVFANFHQGQDAILLLGFVVLGFRAWERGEEFAAGCWLGLGVFKYHLILPLVLVLAIWKGRKLAMGFGVVTAAAALVSVGIVGWHGALRYPVYVWRVVSEPAYGGIPARQLPNVLGLAAGWPVTPSGGLIIQLIVLVCTLGLLAVVVRLRGLAPDHRLSRLAFACLVIVALLIGYSTNSYDLSLLVLPLALVIDYCAEELRGNPDAWGRLLAPVVPLLISPLWFFLWMRWEQLNLMAVFLVWWLFAIRGEMMRRARSQHSRHEPALA